MRSILKVESARDFKKVHIAFWAFWLTLSAILNFSTKEYFTLGLFLVRTLLVNICPFYSVYAALKLSKKGEKVNYWLRILLVLLGMGLSYGAHWYYFVQIASATGEVPKTTLTGKIISVSFVANYLYFFLFGLMFYFFEDLVQKREEAKLAENKRHAAETAFLRAQINPHFLLNTLNFFTPVPPWVKARSLLQAY